MHIVKHVRGRCVVVDSYAAAVDLVKSTYGETSTWRDFARLTELETHTTVALGVVAYVLDVGDAVVPVERFQEARGEWAAHARAQTTEMERIRDDAYCAEREMVETNARAIRDMTLRLDAAEKACRKTERAFAPKL